MQRERPLVLPRVPIDVAEVAKAADEFRRFTEEHNAESERLYALEEARAGAVKADEEAFGAALRRGDEDPGPVHVKAADATIAESRRKVGALAAAVSTAGDDLVTTVEKARSKWEAKLERQTSEARAALAAAVEALASAHVALSDRLTLRNWLAAFPEARWKPPGELARVFGLKSPAGEEYRPAVVIEALRQHGRAAPEPADPPPTVRPLRPPTGTGVVATSVPA